MAVHRTHSATEFQHHQAGHGLVSTRTQRNWAAQTDMEEIPATRSPGTQDRTTSDKNIKIVIVGAGASGIAAASKLIQNGFKNVTLFEAEGRFGGRVNTIPFGDGFIDLGAQWCHGEVGNPSYELANPLNLLEHSILTTDNLRFAFPNGVKVKEDEGLEQFKLLLAISSSTNLTTYEGRVGDFIKEKYKRALKHFGMAYMNEDLVEGFLKYYRNFVLIRTAMDDWNDDNGPGFTAYEKCDGNQMLNWKNGSIMILKVLMKLYPDPLETLGIEDKIIYNSEVTKINWDGDLDSKVLIETKNGENTKADKVIFTPSLGVLKERYEELFNPPLPTRNIQAIKGLSIGTVGKVYFRFETSFWPQNWGGIHVLWTDKLLLKLKSENYWLGSVMAFLTVDRQPSTLCIRVENARDIEAIEEGIVVKELVDLLRSLVPEMIVPDPIEVKRTQWYSNPYFRGTYSFRGINATILGVSPRDLEEPLRNSQGEVVVQFAGEATHQTHFSTVHGAIETGWREAQRIIDEINN